ncbi:hypothetical protein E2C01_080409 [Portunus trituberculatus]|uniref:Uncharacterized protein n=1 Tax=Portunus trituberculatus TaxID=210409 RepID=A0A5B7IU20_PORTR|nr:hypothetical protein [Portunus trituberculatus]
MRLGEAGRGVWIRGRVVGRWIRWKDRGAGRCFRWRGSGSGSGFRGKGRGTGRGEGVGAWWGRSTAGAQLWPRGYACVRRAIEESLLFQHNGTGRGPHGNVSSAHLHNGTHALRGKRVPGTSTSPHPPSLLTLLPSLSPALPPWHSLSPSLPPAATKLQIVLSFN